jgi:hypothetical protein
VGFLTTCGAAAQSERLAALRGHFHFLLVLAQRPGPSLNPLLQRRSEIKSLDASSESRPRLLYHFRAVLVTALSLLLSPLYSQQCVLALFPAKATSSARFAKTTLFTTNAAGDEALPRAHAAASCMSRVEKGCATRCWTGRTAGEEKRLRRLPLSVPPCQYRSIGVPLPI